MKPGIAMLLALGGMVLADPGSAQERPALSSWTSDALPVSEGAIITILIDELTVASADRDELSARQRGRDVRVGAGLGGMSLDGGLRTTNDVSDRTRGESTRRERFAGEVSARVVELLPGGVARIEGSKKVQIDDHEQEVVVRGFVRTQDITAANTVESWQIANAELLYDSNEELGKTGGIWSRLLDLIIP